ncbi:hypothetical protein [Congzhengia sp.]|uniref:hypothetical protein n=1 Tax=Congzhengia sp. TaxID=2944168 RepID=UPI0030770358
MAIDWVKIKNEYVTTNIGQRELAKKNGVSPRQVAYRSKREGWFALKQQSLLNNCRQAAHQQVQEDGRTVEIRLLADKLCEKTNLAIDNLKDGEIDTQRLRQLVQSVKDLKELVKTDGTSCDTGRLETLVKGLCEL